MNPTPADEVARLRVNGKAATAVSVLDRGLLYGDGLFETILYVSGAMPLWQRHLARLHDSAQRLQLVLPLPSQLAADCVAVAAGLERAVIRLTITRGIGERGYAAPAQPRPTWVVWGAPAPSIPAAWYRSGIRVHCCELRLAAQARLAGIKHLNRLEQVLARAEWNDAQIAEGLLRNHDDHVICATAANVFVARDGILATPSLTYCGVAGVARAEVLARRRVDVRPIHWDELMQADELFLSSSVRGIVPVTAVGDRCFAVGAITRSLQRDWRELGLMDRDDA